MLKSHVSRYLLLGALFASSLLFTGCDSSGRLSVQGEVTFEGEPIKYGHVKFTPISGTEGPTGGAEIRDGAYKVAAVRGLFDGTYRVEIQAWVRDGKVSVDPVTGEKTQGGNLQQFLPLKFNEKSKLTVEIKRGGESYDFDLQP